MNHNSLPEAVRTTPVGQTSRQSMARPKSIEVKNVKFCELPRSAMDSWQAWSEQPEFYSPYFHPEFATCADRVRDDVSVLLGYSNDQLIGILPYQVCGESSLEPVGGAVNDYHGVLCDVQNPVGATELLRAAEFQQFKFHSLVSQDNPLNDYVYNRIEANVADFSTGREKFYKEIRDKSSTIRRHPQKTRKMIRELGPLRLELDCRSNETLQWVIEQKRKRYARTGVVDFFGVEWTRNLLQEIFETRTEDFGGLLSALYAGDQLVAAHFGMRCRSTVHYWYPVYDSRFKIYSPGTQMFLDIVEQSKDLGIQKIDFGYGEDPYKARITNQRFHVLRGCIDFNSFRSGYKKRLDQLVRRVKSSRIKQPVKRLVRLFMPGAGQPRV